jgi:hypothetical protein
MAVNGSSLDLLTGGGGTGKLNRVGKPEVLCIMKSNLLRTDPGVPEEPSAVEADDVLYRQTVTG